jgi:hypothetical protein
VVKPIIEEVSYTIVERCAHINSNMILCTISRSQVAAAKRTYKGKNLFGKIPQDPLFPRHWLCIKPITITASENSPEPINTDSDIIVAR